MSSTSALRHDHQRPKTVSGCVSGYVNDVEVPEKGTYRNLHKSPNSQAEFLEWVAGGRRGDSPRVVKSYSGRQAFLKSYRFPNGEEEDIHDMQEVKKRKKRNEVMKEKETNGKKRKTLSGFFTAFGRILSCKVTVSS